jgi:hypothetical protein
MTDRTQAMTVTASDPTIIIAAMRRFGLASDGADLRDLERAISALKARIAELEANEKAYEEIIGKKTYREVADRIRELEAVLQDIGEFCSGDQSPLGSVVRLGRIQSIASTALQPKATP